MEFHPRLGWIPRVGRISSGNWTSTVNESRFRSNGKSLIPAGRPILAVGDSFAFGDEVDDNETWAAQLEELLNKRVLNAGVGAYGIDQAFLRTELLLEQYNPEVVILSFISDNINRTEYSYYPYGRGWKPYFVYRDGTLILRNVPVPDDPAPGGAHRLQTLRRALSYSFLADKILGKLFPRWWRDFPKIQKIHHDGDQVSVDLLVRLNTLAKGRGIRFIAVALATNGKIGDNARLPIIVARARQKGVEVLDLSTAILKRSPKQLENLFMRRGHYSPTMNRWTAEQIAAFLRDRGG